MRSTKGAPWFEGIMLGVNDAVALLEHEVAVLEIALPRARSVAKTVSEVSFADLVSRALASDCHYCGAEVRNSILSYARLRIHLSFCRRA
jgi:hypothetical protein